MTARPLVHCNPKSVLEMVDFDRAAFVELVTTFLETVDRRLERLETALHRGCFEALRDQAHAIKGSLAVFEAAAGRTLAEQIEHLGADCPAARAGAMVAALRDEVDGVCADLRRSVDPAPGGDPVELL